MASYRRAMGMIRSLISMAILGLFLVIGFTVPVGQRTIFGHVRNIWASSEAQELVEGVKESSEPLVQRVKRGVSAGLADECDGGIEREPTPTLQDGGKTNPRSKR